MLEKKQAKEFISLCIELSISSLFWLSSIGFCNFGDVWKNIHN